jgi:predicted translin family RNA/ssDNA-binding protein
MINKKFIQKLKKDYQEKEGQRRQIISRSNIILHDSKRIIFSLHRGEIKQAAAKFAEIEKNLSDLNKKFGQPRLLAEGSYKAGVEEYVEAKTFAEILQGKRLDKIKEANVDLECFLGGVCDLTGELVRVAINEAAAGRIEEVPKIKETINEILSELVEFDMTGYLRTKYDQAKGNLRKIEQVDYEIKIRK